MIRLDYDAAVGSLSLSLSLSHRLSDYARVSQSPPRVGGGGGGGNRCGEGGKRSSENAATWRRRRGYRGDPLPYQTRSLALILHGTLALSVAALACIDLYVPLTLRLSHACLSLCVPGLSLLRL